MKNKAVNKSMAINVQTDQNLMKLNMHSLLSTTEKENDAQATRKEDEDQRWLKQAKNPQQTYVVQWLYPKHATKHTKMVNDRNLERSKGFTIKNLPQKGSQSITLFFSFFFVGNLFFFFYNLSFPYFFLSDCFLTPTFPQNLSTP